MTHRDPESDPDASDEDIFKAAMKNVTPLKRSKQRIERLRPSPSTALIKVRRHSHVDGQEANIKRLTVFSEYVKLPAVTSDDLLSYRRDGISAKVLRNLRQRQYNPGAVIDLHGKTIDEAREALEHFLDACRQQKIQCALIIHGRGSGIPIIKNRLNHWLRETSLVLAFCSIHSGALHVLLTRKFKK